MRIQTYTTKGKRSYNEDRSSVLRRGNITLCGIYDGHGGEEVSSFLKKKLGSTLIENTDTAFHTTSARQCCKKVSQQLNTYLEKKHILSGSTALVAMIKNNEIITVNVGDCRGIICRDGLAIPLTKDHKPGTVEEKARIQKMGGKIQFDRNIDGHRVQGMSVSRSFGDSDVKYVSDTPDINRFNLKPEDSFILLASDGLWDSLENQQVAEFIKAKKGEPKLLEKLAKLAITKGSSDNITIALVHLGEKKTAQRGAGKTKKTTAKKATVASKSKTNKKTKKSKVKSKAKSK